MEMRHRDFYREPNPDRIKYFGDPISMFDFNATTIMSSFKQRWTNSAQFYSGLQIADKVPLHDTSKPNYHTLVKTKMLLLLQSKLK